MGLLVLNLHGIDWVIVGAESEPKYREMERSPPSASAGRSLTLTSVVTKRFTCTWVRALGTRSARAVRRHAHSSRRSAPRPWAYSARLISGEIRARCQQRPAAGR